MKENFLSSSCQPNYEEETNGLAIDAENREEAIRIAKEKYRNEEIILDYDDFKDVNFRSV